MGMKLQIRPMFHKFLYMNARTVLPLAILTGLLSLSAFLFAADNPPSSDSGQRNLVLPDSHIQEEARAALFGDNPAASTETQRVEPSASTQPKTEPAPVQSESASAPAQTTSPPPAMRMAAVRPDTDAQAQAREALFGVEPATSAATQSPQEPEPEQPEATPTEPESTAAATTTTPPPASTAPALQPDTTTQAEARDALWAGSPAATTSAPAAGQGVVSAGSDENVSVTQQRSSKSGSEITASSLTAGMQAPALPLTPAQQQQLAALLQRYRSDQISAAEYHDRRAEILGEK